MNTERPLTYVMAMRDFFGLRPGTTLSEFAAELKQLTDADKIEMRAGLEANGYKITT